MISKIIKLKVIILSAKTYTEKYAKMTDPIRESTNGIRIIRILDKLTTRMVYLAYISY